MIIVMHPEATTDEVTQVLDRLTSLGADVAVEKTDGRTVVNGTFESTLHEKAPWGDLPGVERVVPAVVGGRQVGRLFRSADTVVDVRGVTVGDGDLVVVAGPCAVESREQILSTAKSVKVAGAHILRGDAFKPRTSPYSFQGMGKAGLQLLAEAREITGLPFVAEVLDPRDVELVASYADMLRIGTRNMSNHALLREVGRQDLPIQLKRGQAATVDEWIDAAEHIHNEGNPQIVLVERGIRGFDRATRNMLDLSAVPLAKEETHLPVMVDPSHACGRRDLVPPLARAAVAVGADGVLIDVHPDPANALVDGAQALTPTEFETLVVDLNAIAAIHR